jgi:hypothetical protein
MKDARTKIAGLLKQSKKSLKDFRRIHKKLGALQAHLDRQKRGKKR